MTKYDWQALGQIAVIVIAVVIVIAALAYAMALGLKSLYNSSSRREPELICAKAGYPQVKYVSGEWYCIGIRDGSTVAVPVGEVGR